MRDNGVKIEIVMRKIASSGSVSETVLVSLPGADVISAVITVFMALHLHKELSEAKAWMISMEQEDFKLG